MAFSGVPVVKLLGRHIVRITGVFLAGAASGTIGFNGDATADIQLPPKYAAPAVAGFALSDLIRALYVQSGEAGGGNESRHIHVHKHDGPPFHVHFSNDQNQDTAELEIWVEYLHSIVR